ncbi:MAG: ribonuclease P protein component [Phycisphaerales bacterium]|nr:MAG: ribonuclease P protein component [Phycisphaerales bacterium]
MDAAPHPPRFTFRRADRLTHAREFQAVYKAGVRKVRGPLIVFALPNGLPRARLGLSVGRRVGNAVARNRVKRLVRDAFRLERHALPPGYDLVVSVRPHEPVGLAEHRAHFSAAWRALDKEWRRREQRRGGGDAPIDPTTDASGGASGGTSGGTP